MRLVRMLLVLSAATSLFVTEARAFSSGSPCSPASGMGASPHGSVPLANAGGFTLLTNQNVIGSSAVTLTLHHSPATATFKGLYLEARNGAGASVGTYSANTGFSLLSCGAVTGSAITTNSSTVRNTDQTITFTPGAAITADDSVVVISGIVVVSTAQWASLAPIRLHRAILGVTPGATRGVRLAPPAPDPFAHHATITYSLPALSPVRLVVQDVSGRLVRVLDEGYHAAGEYRLVWDGRDDAGRSMAPGVYFYRLDALGSSHVRRAVMLAQ